MLGSAVSVAGSALLATLVMDLDTARSAMAARTSFAAFGCAFPFCTSNRRFQQHHLTNGDFSTRSLDNPGGGALLARCAAIQRTARRMTRRATRTISRMRTPTSIEKLEGRFRTTGGQLGITIAGFLVNVASATAETLPGAAPEMGARLDAPAAASFGAVVVAFGFLQARIRAAIKARTARREYEAVVKETRNQMMAGMATEEDLLIAEERMAQLINEEAEARKVDILGVPFNVVIPDGGGGTPMSTASSASVTSTSTSTGAQVGVREAAEQRAETDLRDGQAREEEMGPATTLKVAALWLVLISQLWLLLVLWNDPMGDPTSTLLQD